MRDTDRDSLNELAGRLLDPHNLAIVVVGDLGEIRPQLEELDLPIKLLDEDGFEIPME